LCRDEIQFENNSAHKQAIEGMINHLSPVPTYNDLHLQVHVVVSNSPFQKETAFLPSIDPHVRKKWFSKQLLLASSN
jgi:hypothetical protein